MVVKMRLQLKHPAHAQTCSAVAADMNPLVNVSKWASLMGVITATVNLQLWLATNSIFPNMPTKVNITISARD